MRTCEALPSSSHLPLRLVAGLAVTQRGQKGLLLTAGARLPGASSPRKGAFLATLCKISEMPPIFPVRFYS